MIRLQLSYIVLLSCINFTAFAFDNEGWPPRNFTQVFTLTGGVGWAQPGQDRTLYQLDTTTDITYSNTYDADKSTQTLGKGELFLGLQWPFNAHLISQLGFAMGGAGQVTIQGPILVNAVDTGSQFRYGVNHGVLGIRGKLISAMNVCYVQPYITGLVGVGFNQAQGFRTSPTIDSTISPPFYEDKTYSFVFSYAIGAGLQKTLNKNWNVAVGYEFTDWGKNGLGAAIPSSWTGNGPEQPTLYTQSLIFSLTYLC